ncbi:hypothetical protein [Kitasatospora albolonga]|uniref:hypothetical protein n=1 Tax=Kitasatospora albolonga TaxID=68173 RepID=UPI0031EF90DA
MSGPAAAFDLAIAVHDQDAENVADVIRRLRASAHAGHAAGCCEQQLNILLTDALTQAGVQAKDMAGTMPAALLAERIEQYLTVLAYPPETDRAVTGLVSGDLDPLRQLRGTCGLLARAVSAVGLGLVVWSPSRHRGLLEAERARFIRQL